MFKSLGQLFKSLSVRGLCKGEPCFWVHFWHYLIPGWYFGHGIQWLETPSASQGDPRGWSNHLHISEGDPIICIFLSHGCSLSGPRVCKLLDHTWRQAIPCLATRCTRLFLSIVTSDIVTLHKQNKEHALQKDVLAASIGSLMDRIVLFYWK